jgi:hypothetical protein
MFGSPNTKQFSDFAVYKFSSVVGLKYLWGTEDSEIPIQKLANVNGLFRGNTFGEPQFALVIDTLCDVALN